MKNIIALSLEEIEQQETDELMTELRDGYDETTPDALITQQDAELSSEIEEEMQENDRVIDTIPALENLLETVSQMPEDLSETDQAMIRNNINMAVAGTDIQADELTPGLESFTTRTVAMEGIGDTLKAAIASVFNSNATILTKSERRFMMFESQVAKIDEELAVIRSDIRSLKDNHKENINVFLGRHAQNEEGIITDKDSFFKAYYKDTEALRKLIQSVTNNGKILDGMLVSTAKSFTSKSRYYETMDENYKKVRNDFLKKIISSNKMSKKSSTDFSDVYVSPKMLGLTNTEVSLPKVETLKDLSSKEASAAIGALNFRLVTSKAEAEAYKKVMFAEFSLTEVEKFLNDVDKTCTEIMTFCQSEARSIKNRRNLLSNLSKAYLMVVGSLGVAHAGATAGALLGSGAGGTLGGPIGLAVGAATGEVAGAITGFKAGAKAAPVVADAAKSINGTIFGFLSNTLKLQNRITKLYNNSTNGVAEAMVNHINLGYGVVNKLSSYFEYK